MGVTVAAPERHRPPCLFHDPRAEVFVRHEQNVFLLRRGLDDFDRVAAGADDVAQGLHCCAAIDVSNRPEIGVGLLELRQLVGWTTFLQRAPCLLIRQHDDLVGVQDFGRFGHEMNPTEHDDIGWRCGRLLRQPERIAHVIGDLLDFRDLVIVREDDRVELLLERKNFACQRIELPCRHRLTHRQALHARQWRHFQNISHKLRVRLAW